MTGAVIPAPCDHYGVPGAHLCDQCSPSRAKRLDDRPTYEVRGVRLNDVYRDTEGQLWEVVGLCTEPQATVRKVVDGTTEQHVIGCLNWSSKWSAGPLRSANEEVTRVS